MKIDAEKIYENAFCKILLVGTVYVLKSRRGNYNDQYHNDLKSLCKQAGLDYFDVVSWSKK